MAMTRVMAIVNLFNFTIKTRQVDFNNFYVEWVIITIFQAVSNVLFDRLVPRATAVMTTSAYVASYH